MKALSKSSQNGPETIYERRNSNSFQISEVSGGRHLHTRSLESFFY